jgi:hypothetical protein
MCNNFYSFRKSCRLGDKAKKYRRVGQATDDNYTHRTRIVCC